MLEGQGYYWPTLVLIIRKNIFPFDYELNHINDMAEKYLNSIGFIVVGESNVGLLIEAKDNSFNSLI